MSSGTVNVGHIENRSFEATLPSLGISATTDQFLCKVNVALAKRMNRFHMRNLGKGDVTITLKKRGKLLTVTDENINAKQVGSTQTVKGKLAKGWVKPKSIVINDSSGTNQVVKDTNGDGKLYQTAGPAGFTYPILVGSVRYNDGLMNFTFVGAVTTDILADYQHTNWVAFGSNITFDMVKGGGHKNYLVLPDNAENWFDSIRDEKEIGFFGKRKTGSDAKGSVNILCEFSGNSEEFSLPLNKEEFSKQTEIDSDFPMHTN